MQGNYETQKRKITKTYKEKTIMNTIMMETPKHRFVHETSLKLYTEKQLGNYHPVLADLVIYELKVIFD